MNWPVRRVALYGYLGNGNIGNDASFETVLAWFKAAHPEVEVSCITIAPEVIAARYGIPSAPLAWRFRGENGNRLLTAFRKLLGRVLDVPRSYALAGPVDAVIVPGMGVLEETLGVRPWGLPLWLFLTAAACRLRKRRFVLLDVGADWASNPLTRWLYVRAVGLATHISYRDQASAAAMARAGAREPEAVAPDLAFAYPAGTATDPEPGRLVVGVMAYYGPADNPIRGADIRRRYVANMAEAVAELVGAGDRVVLVGGDRVDVDVAREVRETVFTARPDLAQDAIVVRELTTFSELTEEMTRARVVVASRFHNLICALRLARPTVSIGYADKNRDLMRAMGLDDYCQDIQDLSAARLVAQITEAKKYGEQLARQIRRETSQYADEVRALLERVAREDLGLARHVSQESDVREETVRAPLSPQSDG